MRYLFPVKTFLLIASLKQIYKYLNSIKIVLSFQSRKYRKLINAWFTQTFLNRENALAMERLVENSIFGRTRRERFVTVLSTMGSAFFYFSYTWNMWRTKIWTSGNLMHLACKYAKNMNFSSYFLPSAPKMFLWGDIGHVPKEHKMLTLLLSTSSLESDGFTEELKLSTSSDECIPGNYVIT